LVQQVIVVAPNQYAQDDGAQFATAAVASTMRTLVVIALILLAVGGGAGLLLFSTASGSSVSSGPRWDGQSSFSCSGNESVSLHGLHADLTSSTAVSVSGNCHFTCIDCNIRAEVALYVKENGAVTIVNGTVIGAEALVDATDNAQVNISGNVTTSGPIKQRLRAHVSAPQPVAPELPPVSSAESMVCEMARKARANHEPEGEVQMLERHCANERKR
jgi:hypothetical protein